MFTVFKNVEFFAEEAQSRILWRAKKQHQRDVFLRLKNKEIHTFNEWFIVMFISMTIFCRTKKTLKIQNRYISMYRPR